MESTTHVAALTNQCLFRGTIVVEGRRRLSDMLNSEMLDVVEMRDAKVYTFDALEEPVQELPVLCLRKRHIHVVAILGEKRHRQAPVPVERIRKAQAPGHLYVGDFHIQGIIVFAGKQKEQLPVLRTGDPFIPIREAVISHTNRLKLRIPTSVALVNNETLIGYQYEEGMVRIR